MESARNSAVRMMDPSTTDTEEARASVFTALGCPSDSVSFVSYVSPSSCTVTMVHLVKVVDIVRGMRLTLDLKWQISMLQSQTNSIPHCTATKSDWSWHTRMNVCYIQHKLASSTRGGHYYTYCTDTCDRDQNLIGSILGLDHLIPAGRLSWSLDFY